ncbi:MAG: Threonylcarbamoyladenosine tRNA methylthiotransferase MtaB [Tenericutes bacterium ADurb.Bin087]|nr:MAG: Threonylcarbamoyladenosine tRNA methylthiotransferase MtaB [Tenericutes bacterium ADurb.Bin087]
MKTFVSVALGCKVNAYEVFCIDETLKEKGYIQAQEDDKVDVAIINTCSVTSNADQKSRQHIRKLAKNYPDAVLVVMGCYAQINKDLMNTIPEIDILVGTSNRNKIVDYIEEFTKHRQKIIAIDEEPRKFKYEELGATGVTPQARAYLKIQDGCDAFCTYCIIPLARGIMRSRDPRDIVNEAKDLVRRGYQEIVLTGIHTGAYGKDLGNINFSDIVEMILAACPTLYKLRVSSIEANEIDDRFLDLMLKDKRIARHLHIPLQSGSDELLRRMNRKYTSSEFMRKIESIRQKVPDIALTTDVIVGFPGESETLFNETCAFIKKANFTQLHVFPYSARTRTPAASFKDQVQGPLKKARVHKLLTLSADLYRNYATKFMGQKLQVLIETYDNNEAMYVGHTTNYLEVRVKSNKDIRHEVINVIFDLRVSVKI